MREEFLDGILVVDLGGQYTHLISRRFRELGVYTSVVPYNSVERHLLAKFKALVLSGSPLSVGELNEVELSKFSELILSSSKPVLGICFGHQLLARLLGGTIERRREFGRTGIKVIKRDPLFNGWDDFEYVWMSHNDCVTSLPDLGEVLALTENECIAAFKSIFKGNVIYGVQFHPEVKHTVKGLQLFENFLNIAGVARNWSLSNYVERIIEEMMNEVNTDAKALIAVSGGIDSTVAALISRKVFKDKLVAVFVNHGFLREGEVEEVLSNLRSLGIEPLYINAEDRFMKLLKGISDCEERRKLIGEEFVKIFKELIENDPEIKYFIQGTTYPDIIESGVVSGSRKIKTHHNVGGIPQWFKIKILEPLKYLYKDEVREVGKLLGVPEALLKRHPFPGPGLAVRVIGVFTKEKLEIVRKASKIVEDTLREYNLYDSVWQAFAVVGDDMWVGVKGDERDQGYILTIRIVESSDGMTADWARIPHEVLDVLSRRITSSLSKVTAVTYVITSKPPSTIEPC
ncbi:MAG: glutamine-hydrolyzing GMP synthase [Desulfurococcaceae archaeon TW002]